MCLRVRCNNVVTTCSSERKFLNVKSHKIPAKGNVVVVVVVLDFSTIKRISMAENLYRQFEYRRKISLSSDRCVFAKSNTILNNSRSLEREWRSINRLSYGINRQAY